MKLDKLRSTFIYTDEEGVTGITELQVLRSNAGYYVGRMCDEGPYTRESRYFNSKEQAMNHLLNTHP